MIFKRLGIALSLVIIALWVLLQVSAAPVTVTMDYQSLAVRSDGSGWEFTGKERSFVAGESMQVITWYSAPTELMEDAVIIFQRDGNWLIPRDQLSSDFFK